MAEHREKIYIAGKISGDPDYVEKFLKAQDKLEAMGYIVLSPVFLPKGMSNAEYMRICFSMIDTADMVGFLEGYNESKGAMLEMEYCKYTEKRAFMIFRKDFE